MLLNFILFFVILAVLVLTHELGHFWAAKISGVKVEEFGFGFPPRLWGLQKGETFYSVNWIPFGGFVKILGENPTEQEENQPAVEQSRSLTSKSRATQIFVLSAGVLCNFVLAWLILTVALIFGLPTAKANVPATYTLTNSQVVILEVLPNSPAATAGLTSGDVIISLTDGLNKVSNPSVTSVQEFITAHDEQPIVISYKPLAATSSTSAVEQKIVPKKGLIGVSLEEIGVWKLPWWLALKEAGRLSCLMVSYIVTTLWHLLLSTFEGQAGAWSAVTGPVGLLGIIGSSASLGFAYLLNLVAMISLNLAVINLLPLPALDGGRIFILLVEALRRRTFNPKLINTINGWGFSLLLLLMAILTVRDIWHLFG